MGPWLVVHGAWLVEQLLGLVACLLRVSRGWCNAGRQLQFTEKYALHSSVMQSLQGDTFIWVIQLTLFTAVSQCTIV